MVNKRMIMYNIFILFPLFLLMVHCDAESNQVINTTNSTDSRTEQSFTDTNGRSLLVDIPRQGRIMNDEKISIKGFIPIVGIGSDDNKPQNAQLSTSERNYNNQLNGNPNNYDDQSSKHPQHQARPEDQRFIGAAIQGLIGNIGSMTRPNYVVQSSINRKSDCICVPFYMCKNGFIRSTSDPYNNLYQQRKNDQMEDTYPPINERSYENYDVNNTKFAEEILGRMIGRQSITDRCGLLRTCCQRSYPNSIIPDEQLNVEYISPEIPPYGQPIYKPPTIEYVYQQQPYNRPSSSIHRPTLPHRLPKLVNAPGQSIPSFDSSSLPIPIRNDHISSIRPVSHHAYNNCGLRQSIGINGRVQNLNYHQSSTEFAEFPWQVAILKRIGPSDNLYVCGGALISPSFILTAAHCIKKFQSHDLKIRLGEWDVHREDEFYPYVEKNVDEIFVHPNFIPRNLMNDVALLKLDSEIDLNQHPHISPICMAQSFELFSGQRCYVAGWGKNAFGQQGEYQSVLMKVDLPVLDSRVCENNLKHTKLGYNFHLDRSMICAGGEPGKDACEGDGGSGLVCEIDGIWKVAGLVSWGLGCGQAGVPGVYTNVGYVRPWIDKIVLPYYTKPVVNIQNFNELINERSLGNATTITTTTSTNSTNKP